MCGPAPTIMTVTATSDKELPPTVVPYVGPYDETMDKEVAEIQTGRFDGQFDDVDKPHLGLKPPHSKVGPSAGPDPYNVKSVSTWIDKHNTTLFPSVQPSGRGLDTSRSTWMCSEPSAIINQQPSLTDRRSLSPLKKHPAVKSPTRDRYAKKLQGIVPSDMRALKNTRSWVPPNIEHGHTFKGSITSKSPFTR